MKKLLALFMTLMVVGMMAGSLVSAAAPTEDTDIVLEEVKINGDTVSATDGVSSLSFEEGEELEIKVFLRNSNDSVAVDDYEVKVKLHGYDEEDIELSVDNLDLKKGATDWVTLGKIVLPSDLEQELGEGTFVLKFEIEQDNRIDGTYYLTFNLEQTDFAVNIKDVDFTPGTTVQAGHTLVTKVRIQNNGEEELEDVKVVVEIPELGIRASDFLKDDFPSGEKYTTDEEEDELFLKIPTCAQAGDYTVKVSVEHDDGVMTESHVLTVLGSDVCQVAASGSSAGKLVLTIGPESQNVVVGKQAVYPVALTNAGTAVKSYVLETSADWGETKMSDNLVVLAPGESKVVYAYVTPGKDAMLGQNVLTLTVKSDDTVLKTIGLTANVVSNEKPLGLRNGLEIALIALVVVLVVVGLILGFSRLRKDEDEDFEDEDKAYY